MFTAIVTATKAVIANLVPVRFGTSGAAEAFVRAFLASSDEVSDYFVLQGASDRMSLQNAACNITGETRDKVKDQVQVRVTANGKSSWKNLRKDESAGKRETRTVQVKSYSRDTRVKVLPMDGTDGKLRDMFGIAYREDSKVNGPNGETYYVFHRIATVVDSSETAS